MATRTTWELSLKAKGGAQARALARDIRDLDASLRSLGESSGALSKVSADMGAVRSARARMRAERAAGDETVRQQARAQRAFDANGRVARAVQRAQARDENERRRIGEGIARAAARADREDARAAQQRARQEASAAQTAARAAQASSRRFANARTEMTDSERIRRAVEKAQARGHVLEGQRRMRAARDATRTEARAQREASQIGRAFRAKRAADQARWDRLQTRQRGYAAREAQRAEEAARERSSRRWGAARSVGGAVLGGAAVAVGAGIGIAGATMSALSTLVSMAGAAAELTANLGGSVLQMIAFRESALTTLRVMARDANGNRLTGAAAAGQAREQFNFAQTFARETPLDAQQVLDLQRQTSAAGFYGQRNRDVVAAAADVGAFNPNDEGASSRFLLGLGQLRNASTVRLQDLRQTTSAAGLSEADTLRAIARAAGVNRRQGESDATFNSRLQRMQSQGRFTGAQGVEGVLAALRERNGGPLGSFARSQGDSLMGTLSNLRSAIFDFVTSIDNIENLGGIKTLKAELNDIVRLFTGTNDTAVRMRAAFAGLVNDAAQFIGSLSGKHGLEDTVNGALDAFEQLRPLVTEVVSVFGVNFWEPVATEIRSVFEAFKEGDVRETAMEAGRLGRAMGEILAFGVDITYAMLVMGDAGTQALGTMLRMLDRITDPEFPARLGRALDPLSRQNLLASIGIGQSGTDELIQEFINIGNEIPAGMTQGIGDGAPALIARMQALNAELASTTRSDLKIHSPSRVFADIGEQIPAGMVQGIDGGSRDVTNAMSNMVAPQGLPGFGGAGLSGLGGMSITIGDIIVHAQNETSGEAIGESVVTKLTQTFERMASMEGP